MVNCTKYDKSLDIAEFVIDTDDEISDLPTTTENGKNKLANMNSVGMGSSAYCIGTKKAFMLSGSGAWVEV